MPVGGTQCIDILFPTFPGIDQVAAPPGKAWLLEQLRQKDVGCQSGMAAIAVGKGMNCRKPVMEVHGYLVRRIDTMINPGRAILTEGTQLRGYLPSGYANILAGFPV